MLSFFYRLLSRFKAQDDITQDMRRTFEEARVDARARGWWSYSIFALKEIGVFSVFRRGNDGGCEPPAGPSLV